LAKGKFPTRHKHAVVKPFLKKASLEKSEIKNFRPVSNLTFLSKILERAASLQLKSHLHVNNLLPVAKSPFHGDCINKGFF